MSSKIHTFDNSQLGVPFLELKYAVAYQSANNFEVFHFTVQASIAHQQTFAKHIALQMLPTRKGQILTSTPGA